MLQFFSVRTANWHAQRLGLGRVKSEPPIESVIKAVQKELDGTTRNMGANIIWQTLKTKHHIRVKRLALDYLNIENQTESQL